MKRNVFILFSTIILCVMGSCVSSDNFSQQVKIAVEAQMKDYPASTLCDLYKFFFQDKFGPGHLLSDTTAAKNYLLQELAAMNESKGALVEYTGWEHRFCRVNLSLVKEEKIPFNLFFDAFIESMSGVETPDINVWREEWGRVVAIIEQMKLTLPGFGEDKQKLDSLLLAGKYAVHHSASYEQLYSPHYRLIRKEVYEKRLKHYIVEK